MADSIVERRLRYIERQKKLGHGVNVRFEGLEPEGSGPPNRHGLPSVPVGQHVVENWPVLDLGEVPNVSLAEWRLEVAGLVESVITPRLYAWKGTKWIRGIEFLDRNRRGFWERCGYSDTAEPWFDDRYSA